MKDSITYLSWRVPVCATHVVATSQPLAAQAGLHILRQGGTAIDAAIATAIALTVVEPTSNGIGSDAFALVWDGQRLHGLNGSGRSPRAWSPARFAGYERMPEVGPDSVTVPGAVDAWVTLWRKWGRLPFGDLFEPAVRYARDGFPVSPVTARAWQRAEARFADRADFATAFLPAGRSPAMGEVFRCPEQALTLEAIARSEGEAFYRGELAQRIVRHLAEEGGAMTSDDLADHASIWVEPARSTYAEWELAEIPPNGQGIAALVALGILNHLPLANHAVDSPGWIHLTVEAMKRGLQDALSFAADPAYTRDTAWFLDPVRLAARAQEIDLTTASTLDLRHHPEHGTVYLTTADAEGRMVSFIQSNYMGFGSGVVVPGTGISLQNRGAGFRLDAGHPNEVGGGKRPFHTIIPGFAFQTGQPWLSFGVMGGHMQAQGHLQTLLRMGPGGQNPQAAIDAPRWYLDESGLRLHVEAHLPADTIDDLRAKGHNVVVEEGPGLFGGAQAILRLANGTYVAGSDGRKDGQAVGY